MHRSPGLRCVSPCYRNRAVCLPRRKLILRSTIYRAICLPRRKIVTTYRAICLPRRKNATIYRAICLPQCWDTVTKYHLKNRGVGKRTIRYHITHRLKTVELLNRTIFSNFPKLYLYLAPSFRPTLMGTKTYTKMDQIRFLFLFFSI